MRAGTRLFVLVITLFNSIYLAAEKKYIWAVVPQFTGTAVHRDWSPVLKHIASKTGYSFELKIYDSIPEFEKGFLKGEPDFAYMNPYHAVMAKEAQGYDPIIRNGKRLLSGIIVVRKDSVIHNVKQLEGEKLAFPSPNAFAASLYMRALLREKEQLQFTSIYSGTHSNSYRQVLIGNVKAAGAVNRTLLKERNEVQRNLKIIYKTPGFPSHPLTVHKRVPDKVKSAVQLTLLEYGKTVVGKNRLKRILLANPIKANYDIDYLPLKLLKLDKYLISY